MDFELQAKIFNDAKMAEYLKNNSHWYKRLNRSPDNFKDFNSEYKKHKRDEGQKKITSMINNLDTVNTIFKMIN